MPVSIWGRRKREGKIQGKEFLEVIITIDTVYLTECVLCVRHWLRVLLQEQSPLKLSILWASPSTCIRGEWRLERVSSAQDCKTSKWLQSLGSYHRFAAMGLLPWAVIGAEELINNVWKEILDGTTPGPPGFFGVNESMAIHSSILVWRTSRTEKPGGLQSIGSQRIRDSWGLSMHTCHHCKLGVMSGTVLLYFHYVDNSA